MKIRILFFWGLLIFAASCQKNAVCLKEAGDIDTLDTNVLSFKYLEVSGIFDVELFNSDYPHIKIITNQNLINNIKLNTDADTLYVTDENSCYFLRDYDIKIKIQVFTNNDFLLIKNHNAASYTTPEGLSMHNFLLKNYAYSCSIKAHFDNYATTIDPMLGTGKYILSGKTASLEITSSGSAYINADNLEAQYALIKNEGISDIYVYVTKSLKAIIANSGNIYYKGSPDTTVIKTGNGELIKN